jgi:RNA polymerase sigma-70 factor (ECF subfamily)
VQGQPEQTGPLASTIELLDRFKQGDVTALELLVERSLPPLRRWAQGRVPRWARGVVDTHDLVQEAVIRALARVESFEVRHPGALQAYLRQAIANHIRDEIGKVGRRPPYGENRENLPDDGTSPLEHAIGAEAFARYESALESLGPADREAIVARLELQQSYEEVAVALGEPSADAARMAVARALEALIKAMNDLGR